MPPDSPDERDLVKEIVDQLQAPIPDLKTLLGLLSAPLAALGILPPQLQNYNENPLSEGAINLRKHIPLLQRAIIKHITPTWGPILEENRGQNLLVQQYFCPDSFSFASVVAGELAMLAYSTIITFPLNSFAMTMLERLVLEYPIDRLHTAAFARKDLDASSRIVAWEDCVRNVMMIPAKVANAVGEKGVILPGLVHGKFYSHICSRCELLIMRLATNTSSENSSASVTYLIAKLVNLGLFPASPPVSRSQPSFFLTTLPTIRSRLRSSNAPAYSSYWVALVSNMTSNLTLQSILTSLFASLNFFTPDLDPSAATRAKVKREARLLSDLLGCPLPEREELWELTTGILIGRDWHETFARIAVCWISGSSTDAARIDVEALGSFLNIILEMWSSADFIKHSLLARHRYLTSLFLVTASYLPRTSKTIESLTFSSLFMQGIGRYIAHLDIAVRRCGMLAAEVIAHMAGKKLEFGDWEGDDSSRTWARELRQLIQSRDCDAATDSMDEQGSDDVERVDISAPDTTVAQSTQEIREALASNDRTYDSDDSATGYDSQVSSRSASPTPSELAEIEKDPTLNVGIKKVPRPVYLAQLGDLIRGPTLQSNSSEPHEADKMEMALNYGEELIRRKRNFGTELEENAVNLVHGFLALQDNYELDDFNNKRQGVMNALVTSSPRKAAPALIEQFFKNQYSTNQRYVALNALALGARELASLPIPPSRVPTERVAFPSKMLPGALHQHYIVGNSGNDALLCIVDSLSTKAIDKQQAPAAIAQEPGIIRERRLRGAKRPNITEVTPTTLVRSPSQTQLSGQPSTTFTQVAAEFFIVPLINRFWVFLRDEQTREERTAHSEGRHRYFGAGTGLILNAVVLSHFLRTLAILVNASHNAPEWLYIIAPDALELGLSLGTKRISRMDTASDDDGEVDAGADGMGHHRTKEASVLTAALELALVVLDGCMESDGGRVLGLEHAALLLGTEEWASKIFGMLEKGLRVEGGGGINEIKLRRAAAGVLLKVEDIMSKWRRSMIDMN